MKSTMIASLIAAALLASACSATPAGPTPAVVARQDIPAAGEADRAALGHDITINVTGENGTIPCAWEAVPACGRGAFASCVQHGTGLGQPGPIARWEWSEWQCFPERFLPGR